jgi:hypothetical protein
MGLFSVGLDHRIKRRHESLFLRANITTHPTFQERGLARPSHGGVQWLSNHVALILSPISFLKQSILSNYSIRVAFRETERTEQG